MSAPDPRTFAIGDTVRHINGMPGTGCVTGVGYGEVHVRWNTKYSPSDWYPTRQLINITRKENP